MSYNPVPVFRQKSEEIIKLAILMIFLRVLTLIWVNSEYISGEKDHADFRSEFRLLKPPISG